ILGVFVRHRIPATGTLQRNYFFEARDGDFQRGISTRRSPTIWITIDLRNHALPPRKRTFAAVFGSQVSANKRHAINRSPI
ncbi:MAG: hypothetical protein WAN52_00890, partial [Pseudolabrys sp.]